MSKKIKGITIDIDGNTTGLSKALTQINSQSKTLQTDLGRIDRLLKLDPGNVELTAEKHKTLADAIENTEKHLDALKNAQDDVEKAFQSGDIGKKQYLDFQEALIKTENQFDALKNKQSSISGLSDAFAKAKNKVSDLGDTISDKIPPSVKKVGDDFKQIGTELDTVKTKLTPVVEKVEDMAVKAGKAAVEIGKIGAGTAKAGIEAVGTAADVAAKGLTAYSTAAAAAGVAVGTAFLSTAESTRETRIEAGKLETGFKSAGHTAEDAAKTYQELYGILGDSGQATEAASHLALLTKNEQDLQKWTTISTGVYATFGASLPIENLAEASNETAKTGQLTGALADALNWAGVSEDDFQDKLDNLSTEQERQAYITETLNGLYSEQADAYKDLNADIIAANEAQAKSAEVLAEIGAVAEPIMTDIKNLGSTMLQSFTPLATTIGPKVEKALESFEEPLESTASGLAGLFDAENYEDNFDEFAEGLADFGAEILEQLEEALPTFLDGFNGLVLGVVSGVNENLPETIDSILPTLIDGFFGLVDTLTSEYLPTLLPLVVDGGLTLFTGLVDGLNAVLDNALIPMLPVMVQQINNTLVSSLPLIISSGIELLSGLLIAFRQVTDQLLPMLPVLISQISDTLISNLPFLITTGFELLLSLIEGISLCLPELIGSVSELVVVIVDTLTADDMLTRLVSAALELILALALGLIDAIPDLIEVVPDIITAVVDAFLAQDWGEIGIDIMRGIGEGLLAGVEAIGDTISDACSSLYDSVTGFFDINSPSRLFRDGVGKYLADGIGVGFVDQMDAVSAQMEDALPTSFDIDADVNANGNINGLGGVGSSSAFAGANININIEGMNIASDYDVERFVAVLDEKLADLAIQQSRAIGE